VYGEHRLKEQQDAGFSLSISMFATDRGQALIGTAIPNSHLDVRPICLSGVFELPTALQDEA